MRLLLRLKKRKEATEMTDKKKGLNLKIYGIIAVVAVGALLAVLTVVTFSTRYIGFSPEKMAAGYVDTIVQTGDGYNAYKDTLLSKNSKFGDFIRVNYIYPEIYENYVAGESADGLKGLNDKELKSENDLNDDGTLEGTVIERMYPFFENLIAANNGFDNYSVIFSSYITELKKVRAEVFGDTYFDDEAFFTAFESNLAAYGEKLTGTEDVFDKDTGKQTKFASEGVYQAKYGKDYKITVETAGVQDAEMPDLSAYGGDIEASEAKIVSVNVLVNGNTVVEGLEITVVRIGRSWYVANDSCDTSVLYNL